ncbi:hypothetical protein DFA_01281 [Cavenderia fasciculata]|uniref:Cathepsin propeptide inhibitor domain-containing protein n=1 Tax=Cavenderia fasciculata TaxID=261658 RepID=F4PRW3_CACFS|nr:uncharacterized protein DFA_01281 [Cavenderia fasciculata]EGG21399.1 hypothetical protein DFA_01281 [Cavenderia fasciculata]|eukprot:XP_004359249.1 hypothetical protein DFA_01281 [Cavenderia fasciculata]
MRLYIFLILTIFIISLSSNFLFVKGGDIPSDQLFQDAFKNWMQAYNVRYTEGEFQSKFSNWRANMIKIGDFNGKINVPDVLVQDSESPTDSSSRKLLSVNADPVITFPKSQVQQLSLNQFSDLTYQEFVSTYTGGLPPTAAVAAAAAAAGLSTGAIIGIAVGGGVLAAGAVGGGSVLAYRKYKKNKLTKATAQSHPTAVEVEMVDRVSASPVVFPATPTTDPNEDDHASSPVPGGINVFDFSKNPRHSITARSYTQE